jgi:hypothetical protein
VGLALDNNAKGSCIVTYIVPDFAAEISGLFSVSDQVLSIDGTNVAGAPSTPLPLRLMDVLGNFFHPAHQLSPVRELTRVSCKERATRAGVMQHRSGC